MQKTKMAKPDTAAKPDNPEVWELCCDGNLEAVRMALEAGALVNSRGGYTR